MYRKLITLLLAFALSGCAWGQYGGSTGMPGSPSPGSTGIYNTHKSYGVNKGAMGALVGGGAAAGILYMTKLRHPTVEGCVGPDGRTLVKDNGKSYAIVGDALRPGERVVVKTKKMKDSSGERALDVLEFRKDLGPCEREARSSPPLPRQ